MRRPLALLLVGSLTLALVAVTAVTGVEPFRGPPAVQVADDGPSTDAIDPFRYRNWSSAETVVRVGEPATDPPPLALVVLNDGSTQSVPLTVSHRPTGETLFEESVPLEASAAFVVEFYRPADYLVTVRTATGTSQYPLGQGEFDCNDQSYGVVIEPGGQTLLTRNGTEIDCD